jgi:hypothetical protein
MGGQSLLDHEKGLGHGALLGIDQQHRSVGHAQHPFHLAAEIRMTGGVDNVDEIVPEPVGAVFRGNGYAPLPFKVHGIHQPFGNLLVVAEHAALAEKLVDQGCLAVIDVGDDCYISDFLLVHIICTQTSIKKVRRAALINNR